MATRPNTRTVYRDSITGRFVSQEKARCCPATSMKQMIHVKPRTRKRQPTQQQGEPT